MARRRASRKGVSPDEGLPLAISPDGGRIQSVEELPELPLPKKVIVGGDAMRVDEWIFRVWPMGKQTLKWLARQAGRWCREDPSPENRAQVLGIVEAVENVILRKSHAPEQREFDF